MEEFLIPEELCKQCENCINSGKDLNRPVSVWDEIPEGCGFEGWIFQEREKEKQKIRKQKEHLLSLKVLLNTATKEEKKTIEKKISDIESTIKALEKYGAKDW